MKYSIVILFVLIPIISSFSATGEIAEFDAKTRTMRYRKVSIPDEMVYRSESDTIYEQLPGWPQEMVCSPTYGTVRGLALADIDNNGSIEVVASSDTIMNIYNPDGTILWSKVLKGCANEAPSVADVDGDGLMEIAQTTRGLFAHGRLYLLDHLGNDIPGWPLYFKDNLLTGSPALADFDSDSIMEIVIGLDSVPIGYLHVFKLDGSEINSNFPVELDNVSAVTATIGDVDNDGQKDIVYCSYRSLYVFGLDGKIKPGFPITEPDSSKYSYQSPLITDIDGSKTLEIIDVKELKDFLFKIDIHDYRGNSFDRWPQILELGTFCPPTVVEPAKDGNFKFYVGNKGRFTSTPVLHGFEEDGDYIFPEFPISEIGSVGGFISIADIDNEKEFEVLFDCNIIDSATGRGFLYAYNQGWGGGSGPVPGFPLRPMGWTYMNGANLGDLNGDGLLDLLTITHIDTTAYIYAWSLEVPYKPEKILFGTYHANNARDGLVPSSGTTEVKSGYKKLGDCFVSFMSRKNKGILIQLEIKQTDNLTLGIYNSIGKKLSTLYSGRLSTGKHTFEFKDSNYSTGVYFLKIEGKESSVTEVKKFVVFR